MEEYIDRIIIAAKKEIEGKKQVDVSLVETLIFTMQTLQRNQIINKLDIPTSYEQKQIVFD